MRERLRLHLGWILGILFVALLVGAFYTYFITTRAILEQAESFRFRRMLVSQLDEPGTFRFFYATNRRQLDPAAAVEQRFASERVPGLQFGSFDTRIEPSLGLGMIIDPSDWFLNEEIRLLSVSTRSHAAFRQQLREQVAGSPGKSLLLVLHGFREAFPSALRKTAFLAHVLDIDTPVLVFDWPGDQGSSLRGYRRARDVAEASAAEFAELLQIIVTEIGPQRLWLLANSMGAQVVVDGFGRLYRDPAFGDSTTEIENVMLAAPDVDYRQFNERFRTELEALAANTTVYVSSNDRALLASRIINRSQRLGESTLGNSAPDPSNPSQELQASSIYDLMQAGSDGLVLVDVTPVNRTRNFHNFSLETPEFYDDLFLRFVNRNLPQSRELYAVQSAKGKAYFVLTRGR